MKNKKKLNLQFGAEIKEFIAEPQAQQFKALDSRVYSFEMYTANPYLSKLLTQGFQQIQSTNSNDRSKKKTNDGINYGIRTFLSWIEKINHKDGLNSNLLLDYKDYLTANNKSWTAYSAYTVIARLAQVLMDKGLIDKFIIPKNIPIQQAINASKAGSTISTQFNHLQIGLSGDDINEGVLSLIVNAAWDETFKLFKILEIGKILCSSIDSTEYIPYKRGITRQEALEAIIKNLYIEFGGLSSNYSFMERFKGYDNEKFVKLICTYIHANKHYNWGITAFEINKYFNPTKELVGNILILLSAAQINPESANYLEIGCLKNDTNPDIVRLIWTKNRAGGEQPSIPFPKGKHENSKTIPNVIQLYENATKELRKKAPESLKELLFIWRNHQTGKKATIQYCRESGHKLIKDALNLIKTNLSSRESNDPLYSLAVQACETIAPSLIRATAINVSSKRLNRDIRNVALMDGRKSEGALSSHYLNNSETKEAFDMQIREAQSLMFDWINSKPIVVSDNENDVVNQLGISEETAKQIINDEFNNGYGASLINDNVIIIDSALNALRMIQWLRKLEGNEQKMLLVNPERWNTVYLPQKKLFNEALGFISKKNKAEALKMNKEFNLPFPEVL